jgi:hypothetical protein
MSDWVTISSSLATAAGTLVLAVATFSSVRSANRSARAAERSLLIGLRPVITPSRDDDPVQRVRFGDGPLYAVPPHGGILARGGDVIYLVLAVRNGGNGLAVIHGWTAGPREVGGRPAAAPARPQQLDIYIPAGDVGTWLGALRDPGETGYAEVAAAIEDHSVVQVDLYYGDHEGGQRAVARFLLAEWEEAGEPGVGGTDGRRATVLRYFNLDGSDPRRET